MTQRDSQRSRVYSGERDAFGYGNKEKLSIAECQVFVDSVTQSAWWKRRCQISKVTVTAGARNTWAWAHYDTIRTSPGSRQRWVMLHELAHIMTTSRPAHGPVFCANFVELVRQFLGKDEGDRLRDCLRTAGVKVRGANRPRELRKVECSECRKPITVGTGWRIGTGWNLAFCTKRCAKLWADAHIIRA